MLEYALSLAAWCMCQFVWQAGLIGIAFAWWRVHARGNPPEARYAGSVCFLVALAAAPLATAVVTHATLVAEGARFVAANTGGRILGEIGGPALTRAWSALRYGSPGGVGAATGIVGVWAIGCIASLVRVLLGLAHVARERKRSARGKGELARRVERLARECGLARVPCVRVLSDGVSPCVVGVRHPEILVPAPALDLTTADELDAILLHELAHVRRADYVVNLGQHVLEALLWFHPVVWIVSRVVREARECCCDAAALRITREPLVLARALVSLEQGRHTRIASPVAAHGGALADRVREMVAMSCGADRSHDAVARTRFGRALTLAVLAFAAVGFVRPSDELRATSAFAGVVPTRTMTISAMDPSGPFRVRVVNGFVAGVALAGRPVARRDIVQVGAEVRVYGASGAVRLRVQLLPNGITWHPRLPGRGAYE